MRVLHLIDPASPGGGACTLRLLAEPMRRLTGIHQDALIIGHRGHAALARRCGVEPIGHLPLPGQWAALARRGLERWVRSYESAFGSYDLVHAWSESTAMLAAVALPRRPATATLAIGPVTTGFRHVLFHRPMPLMATSIGVRREHVAAGIDPQLISIIPPAVASVSDGHADDRSSLRRRWGVDDSTFVVALLSEPARWADSLAATTIAMTVAVAGTEIRLLVHPAADRRHDAHRLLALCSTSRGPRAGRSTRPAGELISSRLLTVEPWLEEPWRIAAGMDAGLLIGNEADTQAGRLRARSSLLNLPVGGWLARTLAPMEGLLIRPRRPMPGALPLLWAMAAGVPVVSEIRAAVEGIVEDGSTGLLVRHWDRMAAADRLFRLARDRNLGRRLGAAARVHVDEYCNHGAYCQRLSQMYERVLAGQTPLAAVEVEPSPAAQAEPAAHAQC